MKKKLLYLIPLVVIGILIGLVFNKPTITKSQLSYLDIKLASYANVQDSDKVVEGTDKVTFDAFFVANGANKRGNCIELGSEKNLRIILSVLGDAEIRDAKIEFVNNNVMIGIARSVNNQVFSEKNLSQMVFNNSITSGRNVDFDVVVRDSIDNDISVYKQTNKVILTGIVDDNGSTTEIRKEVSYDVDWYLRDIRAGIYDSYTINSNSDEDKTTISYSITTSSSVNKMLKSANLDIDVPEFNESYPIAARVVGTNVKYNYDSANHKLTASKDAVLEGTVITNAAYDYVDMYDYAINNFTIELDYPPAHHDSEINAPSLSVTAWYDAYNNPDSDFDSVVSSNTYNMILVQTKKVTNVREKIINEEMYTAHLNFYTSTEIGQSYSPTVGYYVPKTDALNIFDGLNTNETTEYNVTWNAYANVRCFDDYGYNTWRCSPVNIKADTLRIDDNTFDTFDNDSSTPVPSRYKRINLSTMSNFGSGAYVKVYNADNDELLHIFTYSNYETDYVFNDDVRSIYLVTSGIDKLVSSYNTRYTFITANIKKEIINDEMIYNYTKEQVEGFSDIYSRTNTDCDGEYIAHYTWNDTGNYIQYLPYYSTNIYLFSDKQSILNNQETNINMTVRIADADDITKTYKNGEFLIVFPKDIINLNINEITVNNPSVSIIGYELEEENDKYFLRIITKNEEPEKYDITINADITPNPNSLNTSLRFLLYGINRYLKPYTGVEDEYDVDKNGNTTEKVSFDDSQINLIISSDVITTTTIKKYDLNNNETSRISPQLTDIHPLKDKNTAKVEIGLVNNSNDPITDIILIGKVGYVGNTYQMGVGELGSKYNAPMTSDGITVPSEISDKVRIYYSTKENPTVDINDSNNDWKLKTDVVDFDDIKSYVVFIDDYFLGKESLRFSFDVTFPMDMSMIGDTTYFTHGFYYSSLVEEAIVNRELGGYKAGIRYAIKYNMNLIDYKMNSNKTIDNAAYILRDQENNTRIIRTDRDGNSFIKGLYANVEYSLKQIDIKNTYVLDTEEKRFKVVYNNSGELELSGNEQGNYKNISVDNSGLNIAVENDTRYDLVLTNTDIDTDELIPFSEFIITGKGYESGKKITTNRQGELVLKGLYPKEEYVLEQVKVINHLLLIEPISFSIVRDSNGVVSIGKKTELIKEYEDLSNPDNFREVYYGDYDLIRSSSTSVSNAVKDSFVTLDLTDYVETYKMDYVVYNDWYSSYAKPSYKLFIVTDMNHIPEIDEIDITSSYRENGIKGTLNTAYEYNSITDSFDEIPITGGRKYYIYLYYRHGNSSYDDYAYFELGNLKTIGDKDYEYRAVPDRENVPYKNCAIQTLVDNDNMESPKYYLNVKSKNMPTYTLEITKKSADTKEPLKNAQYQITGAGLPTNGVYIKTDENGKATYDLTKEYVANNTYKLIIDGYDYSIANGNYSIKEVTPPVGYQKDNQEVGFKVTSTVPSDICSYNYSKKLYECTMNSNATFAHSLFYNNQDIQFVEEEFDEATNTLKVTMYDYPLITITKKDYETGLLLPNTLFAIYKVTYDSRGNEVLEPAKDSNGVVLGKEIRLNNVTYYVLATDENGKLNLDLSTGEYKALEVQASDEKYQIDETGYYFNVGATVEHEDGSFGFYNSFNAENFASWISRTNPSISDVIPTSDGGMLYIKEGYTDLNGKVFKYNKNGEVDWIYDYKESKPQTCIKGINYYYDKPLEYVYGTNCSPGGPDREYTQIVNVIELEDSYMINFVGSGFDKIDKNGNLLWRYYDNINSYLEVKNYLAACDKNTGKLVELSNGFINSDHYDYRANYDPNNPAVQRDDNTFYCEFSTYSDGIYYLYDRYSGEFRYGFNTSGPELYNSTISNIAVDSQGNSTVVNSDYYNGHYDRVLSNGEVLRYSLYKLQNNISNYCVRNVEIPNDPEHPEYGIHYEQQYNAEWCVDFSSEFAKINEGITNNAQYASYVNENIAGSIFLTRFDKDGNIISMKDLSLLLYNFGYGYVDRDNGLYDLNYGRKMIPFNLYTFENDDILLYFKRYGFLRLRYNEETNNYDLVYKINSILKSDPDYYTYGTTIQIKGNTFSYMDEEGYIYSYDANGQLYSTVNPIPGILTYNLPQTYSNCNGMCYGSNTSYYKVSDDRYLIIQEENISDYYVNDYEILTIPYTLDTGEVVYVDHYDKPLYQDGRARLIIYEMDADGNYKSIKQYYGFENYDTSQDRWYNSRIIPKINSDGTKLMFPLNAKVNTTMTNTASGEQFTLRGNVVVFDIKDETRPQSPEAYSIEVLNDRKLFNINITSGENGVTEVLNGNTSVNSVVNETKSIENIKYGDDSIYTIKPKGNDGFVVDQVLLNDEEYPFTVSDDGTVTLDKFTNVTGNINLTITFKPGNSIVIVHHYKKGTTERIASDDIISGDVNASYETIPAFNPLYELAKDENGEYILPENATGNFAPEATIVIYYYEESMVNLKVNYYIKNTTLELAPSDITQQRLGSSYKTTKKNIIGYAVTDIIGEEEGTLDRENTVVTYMYQSVDQTTLKIRYVDKETGKDLINPIIKIVNRNDEYETNAIDIEGYEFFNRTENYKGIADAEEIEIIYYYAKPEVKGSPQTGDTIISKLIMFISSTIGLVILTIYIKKNKIFTK